MIRRHGDPPVRGETYRLRPGAYAILTGPAGVLLTEQTTPDLCELQLPGGGIDPGESPLPALAREVLEETGHTCRILCHLGSYRRFAYMPEYDLHAEKLCQVFLGRAGPRLCAPTEAGHRAVWAGPDMAAGLVASAGDAALLAAWRRVSVPNRRSGARRRHPW